jgi:hypothetical protein
LKRAMMEVLLLVSFNIASAINDSIMLLFSLLCRVLVNGRRPVSVGLLALL